MDLQLTTYASCEAQVAALSDDIAYNNHDIDDGLRAGLFAPEDPAEVPLVGPVFAAIEARYPGLERSRLIHEAVRKLISLMVGDLLAETRRRLAEARPQSADDVRRMGRPVVAFSEEMQSHDRALKAFLFKRMYRHYKVNRMTAKAKRVVRELFAQFLQEPDGLPPEWQARTNGPNSARTARVVADYIAGMTDNYALREHGRLF
jgi:dGTPase